jgi:hypothetical protein
LERQHPRGEGKKLRAAVEHWSSGGNQPNPDLLADAEAYGLELPPEATQAQPFAVFAENWPAVELFLRCATQWRAGEPTAMGPCGVYGLDYAVVLSLGRLYLSAQAEMAQVLEDVQVMERRALELAYEVAQRQQERSR